MNNYNTSTTGYSVDVNIFYDGFLSQLFFDENFIIDKQERSLFYTGCEHSADDFIITVNDTPHNRAIFDDDADADINDLIADHNYHNGNKTIHDKLSDYTNMRVEYTTNFTVMISDGYSQGDRRAVYILNDGCEHVTRDHIDHYLWDAPITARVEINGDDVLFEDDILGDDFYTWDADAARDRITARLTELEYSAECIAEVLALIPTILDYI